MANTAITPTRMVLNQLKGRLKTARRGHKLLKDKRDELMRQFLDNVRLNKQLRTKVEQGLTEAFGSLSVASAIMSPEMLEQSLLYPARQADADLLNQYFRENTGPVDASALNLCDNVIDLSGYAATDPNIQWMGKLMTEADEAQKDPNQNLDGSNQVTDVMASESAAESESTEAESQPAA